MTTNVHVVIKLGGAAITHKNECEQFNAEAAAVVAQQIALLHQQDVSVIIVHGAGGFGHFLAKAAGLSAGGDGTLSERRAAAAQTHASVTKLNGRIIDQLLKCGVPAVGLSPIGTWRTRGRSVIGSGAQAVGELLRAGLVPVIHGDVVVDESQGWCILSGDTLVTELCKVFRPQVAVFMTNVPGVFDRPPEKAGAQLIRSAVLHEAGGWAMHGAGGALVAALETTSAAHDTTGGMRAKLDEAGAAVPHTALRSARIVEAGSHDALQACLPGALPAGWLGTEVRREETAMQQ